MKLKIEIDTDKVVITPAERGWPSDAQRLGTQLYYIVSCAARELHSAELAVGDSWPVLDDDKNEVGVCTVEAGNDED